jgi:ubiquinone/menaquinone biosynthesis C-methylase UbiE
MPVKNSSKDVKSKWPKALPEMTDVQKWVSDEWMKYWHEISPKHYGILDRFNNGYPMRALSKVSTRGGALEIGAGLGEHIFYEDLSAQQYTVLELRSNMANVIQTRFPSVRVCIGDIQSRTEFGDNEFDRILAIHVLEHLPNLPLALDEVYRILKDDGIFTVVIPCEGSLAHRFARLISTQRIFNRKFGEYGVKYNYIMSIEHINKPNEIMEELKRCFRITNATYFPIPLKLIFCNLCIGLELRKR